MLAQLVAATRGNRGDVLVLLEEAGVACRGWRARPRGPTPKPAWSRSPDELVLEDLHWADPETLTIVEYLAANRRRSRFR